MISVEDAAKKLRQTDSKCRMLLTLFDEGLTQIIYKEKKYFLKKELAIRLGLPNLDAPLLLINEVAVLLRKKNRDVMYLIDMKILLKYQLRETKGSPLLFVRREVLQVKKFLRISRRDYRNFIPELHMLKKIKKLFVVIVTSLAKKDSLPRKEARILQDFVLQALPVKTLAKKYNMTETGIVGVFDAMIKKSIDALQAT